MLRHILISLDQAVTVRKKFTYREFYASSRFPGEVKKIPFNNRIARSIAWWVLNCGDPFRADHPDVRLRPTSGVRSERLNDLVGGSDYSNHLVGESDDPEIAYTNYCAVDLVSPDMAAADVFIRIINGGYPYRQLILYPERNFVHWSWNRIEHIHKHEVMVIRSGHPGVQ